MIMKFWSVVFVCMSVGCVDYVGDGRFGHRFTACEVDVRSTHGGQDVSWATDGRFDISGGYNVWDTSPSTSCSHNPTLSEGEYAGTELFITYPTGTDPLLTGDGSVADGKFPVIVFAHANSSVCRNFQRYRSLHNHWASYGFIIVSVDEAITNCVDMPISENLQIRTDIQVAGLHEIRRLNEDPDSIFFGKVDADRFLFAGHSRGGAASYKSAFRETGALGVIALQALTSFASSTLPYDGFPVLEVIASKDTDLEYPAVDVMEDAFAAPYSTITLVGGIHGFTADNVPPRSVDEPEISEEEQHAVTNYFSAAFLQYAVGLENDWSDDFSNRILFSHFGAEEAQELTSKGVITRWRNANENILVDAFDGRDPATNALGGATSFSGVKASENATYMPDTNPTSGLYGYSYSLRLIADTPGFYKTSFDPIMLTSDWALDARIKNADEGAAPDIVKIVLEVDSYESEEEDDDSLSRVEINALEFAGPLALSNRFTQIHIPLSAFGLNSETTIRAISVELEKGEVFIDDLRLTSPSS